MIRIYDPEFKKKKKKKKERQLDSGTFIHQTCPRTIEKEVDWEYLGNSFIKIPMWIQYGFYQFNEMLFDLLIVPVHIRMTVAEAFQKRPFYKQVGFFEKTEARRGQHHYLQIGHRR